MSATKPLHSLDKITDLLYLDFCIGMIGTRSESFPMLISCLDEVPDSGDWTSNFQTFLLFSHHRWRLPR